MRKKIFFILVFAVGGALLGVSTSSCSQKTGCPINEEAHAKPDKKGRLPSGGGRSKLFPKKMRKKLRKN